MRNGVFQILELISKDINELKTILQPLSVLSQQRPARRRSEIRATHRATHPKKRRALTSQSKPAESAASMRDRQRAGLYGALLRRLAEVQRAELRKIKDAEGYDSAIETASKLVKRRY